MVSVNSNYSYDFVANNNIIHKIAASLKAAATGDATVSKTTKVADTGQQPPAVVVNLSEMARAAIAANRDNTRDFSLVGKDARAVLDSQYADAKAKGTSIRFRTDVNGVDLDYSSLSDRAVAAVSLNRDGLFSPDEVEYARGSLAQRTNDRMVISHADSGPFDHRAAYKSLMDQYDSMTAEVREALKWTPQTRAETEAGLRNAERNAGQRLDELDDDQPKTLVDLLMDYINEMKKDEEAKRADKARRADRADPMVETREPPAKVAREQNVIAAVAAEKVTGPSKIPQTLPGLA